LPEPNRLKECFIWFYRRGGTCPALLSDCCCCCCCCDFYFFFSFSLSLFVSVSESLRGTDESTAPTTTPYRKLPLWFIVPINRAPCVRREGKRLLPN
jgi:hypothetical protein